MHHGVLLHMKGYMRHWPKSPPSNSNFNARFLVCLQSVSTNTQYIVQASFKWLFRLRKIPSKFLKDCSGVPSQMASLCIWRYTRSIYVCSIFSLSCYFHLMYTIDQSDIRTSLISGQLHWMPRCVIMDQWRIFCRKLIPQILVKIRVDTNLDPLSYATKITSSLAFKQVVEWVSIFCSCSEHPLNPMPLSFVLKSNSCDAFCTNCFRMSWTLSCQFKDQNGTWNSRPALWLKTVYDIHTSTSLWVKLREFVRPSNHLCETANLKGTTILTRSRENVSLQNRSILSWLYSSKTGNTEVYNLFVYQTPLCLWPNVCLCTCFAWLSDSCSGLQPLHSACPSFLRSFGWTLIWLKGDLILPWSVSGSSWGFRWMFSSSSFFSSSIPRTGRRSA